MESVHTTSSLQKILNLKKNLAAEALYCVQEMGGCIMYTSLYHRHLFELYHYFFQFFHSFYGNNGTFSNCPLFFFFKVFFQEVELIY